MLKARNPAWVDRVERFLDWLFARRAFQRLDAMAARFAAPLLPGLSLPRVELAEPPPSAPVNPRESPAPMPPESIEVEPMTPPPSAGKVGDSGAARRFLLTVDDAGQFLVAVARELTLGHLRAGEADLPFLADVGRRHARLSYRESLQEGPGWWIEPLAGEAVHKNEELLTGAVPLVDGDGVRLGANLSMRFRTPDPASASARLDFLHGAECLGAAHAVLMTPGAGGRVRIGAAGQRHIRVANLLTGVTLVVEEDPAAPGDERLFVHCEAGISDGAGPGQGIFALPCPPPQRVDLSVGKPKEGRPPFGLALAPVAAPGGLRGGER
ncbi:MAG: FHA domain-containing protein [Planctomycetota bacterium]|nr:FHA domain-containing protein [Planctomycetota bacterium]